MRVSPFILIIALSVFACGSSTTEGSDQLANKGVDGLEVYTQYCKLCHGKAGDLGMGESKDLKISVLTVEEMIAMISNGKGKMTPYKDVLTAKQIEAVAEYAHTLRTSE